MSAADIALPLKYTPSGRAPLIIGLHGFSDFQKIKIPTREDAHTIDLFMQYRDPKKFLPQDRCVLGGFVYDVDLLELAEHFNTMNRQERIQEASEGLTSWLESETKDRRIIKQLSQFFTPENYFILRHNGCGGSVVELKGFFEVVNKAVCEKGQNVTLITFYDKTHHQDMVDYHRDVGHNFIDLSGDFEDFQTSSGVTVVNLPELPLRIFRPLLASSDLATLTLENHLIDVIYLCRSNPQTAPITFFDPINNGRLAVLADPWTHMKTYQTLRDFYAYCDLKAGRANESDIAKLVTLIQNRQEADRYKGDFGEVAHLTAQVKENNIELLNMLNVICNIVAGYDRSGNVVRILRGQKSQGANPAYSSKKDHSVEGDISPKTSQAWREFESSERMTKLSTAERVLTRYRRELELEDRQLMAKLDELTKQYGHTKLSTIDVQGIADSLEGKIVNRLGSGGLFLVLEVPGSDFVLKYRYLHDEPFLDAGLPFEFQDRYYHIRNTIRSIEQAGEFIVPEIVAATEDLIRAYPQLRRFIEKGMLAELKKPIEVRVSYYRRDGDPAHTQTRTVSISTAIFQQRVRTLEEEIMQLLKQAKLEEAKERVDHSL